MEEIIKLSFLCVICVVAAFFLQAEKAQYGKIIGICMGIFLMNYCLRKLTGLAAGIYALKTYLGAGGEYLQILVKALGITYVCEFAAGICRDNGYGMLSSQIELMGKLTVMLWGVSILSLVIEQIQTLF